MLGHRGPEVLLLVAAPFQKQAAELGLPVRPVPARSAVLWPWGWLLQHHGPLLRLHPGSGTGPPEEEEARGRPLGAGWAACPWLRVPRDITAQARRAASAGRGPGPGCWGGPGRPRGHGGTLCTPARCSWTQCKGTSVHTQHPRVHSCVHMRVVTAQPRAQHRLHACTVARPPPPCAHAAALHPLHTDVCTLAECCACTPVHGGPRTRVGRRAAEGGGLGERRGAGLGAVWGWDGTEAAGRPGGWGETFLAALVILSGSKSVPGMFLIPGSRLCAGSSRPGPPFTASAPHAGAACPQPSPSPCPAGPQPWGPHEGPCLQLH